MRQERPHFSRRNALVNLLLGELCEYKGRFIPDIVDGLFLICEETYWGVSAHYPIPIKTDKLPDAQNCYIDLFAAETAATVALCYYLLYDELYDYCPDILLRVEYEMKRRILDPYLAHTDFWWMGNYHMVNNWNPWVISNMLTAFLLMENNPTRKYKAIRKMIYEINNIYTVYPDDGGCDEGVNYWSVSAGTLFEFIYQLYVSIVRSQHPFLVHKDYLGRKKIDVVLTAFVVDIDILAAVPPDIHYGIDLGTVGICPFRHEHRLVTVARVESQGAATPVCAVFLIP